MYLSLLLGGIAATTCSLLLPKNVYTLLLLNSQIYVWTFPFWFFTVFGDEIIGTLLCSWAISTGTLLIRDEKRVVVLENHGFTLGFMMRVNARDEISLRWWSWIILDWYQQADEVLFYVFVPSSWVLWRIWFVLLPVYVLGTYTVIYPSNRCRTCHGDMFLTSLQYIGLCLKHSSSSSGESSQERLKL